MNFELTFSVNQETNAQNPYNLYPPEVREFPHQPAIACSGTRVSRNITVHDLYETYPDFDIDVEREKELLVQNDVIIWHHPFYWYSSPPLLKQWIDMVLEYGWAYGEGGDKLSGKIVFNAITTGGNAEAYCPDGHNCYTVPDFMRPFEQTARLCLMDYLPPFAVMGTHKMTQEQILQTRRPITAN